MRVLAIAVTLSIACGSNGHADMVDSGPTPDGAPPDALVPDAPTCGSAVCIANACGSGSACGEPVTCAACSFSSTPIIPAFGSILVATGSGAAPVIAAAMGSTVATRGSSGWTTEMVTNDMGNPVQGELRGFALASDGTRWLAYANTGNGAIEIVHGSAADGWTIDSVGTSAFGGGRLAIAADGTVAVAFMGSATGVQPGLILATSSAGGPWTLANIVQTSAVADHLDVEVDPTSATFAIAFQGADLRYVTVTTAGIVGAVEVVDPGATASANLQLAFDPTGQAHVGYWHDSVGDRTFYHAARGAAGWTPEPIGGRSGADQVVSIAADGSALALVYNDDDGLFLAQRFGGVWLTQAMGFSCLDGSLGAAYIAGTLELVDTCTTSLVERVRD